MSPEEQLKLKPMPGAFSAAFFDAWVALTRFVSMWDATPDATKVLIMVIAAGLGVYGGSQSDNGAVSAGLLFGGFVLLSYALYLGMQLI
ncbi:MAG: hypothetical protein ACREQN_19625 [Candidatus Binataceae bacterium]